MPTLEINPEVLGDFAISAALLIGKILFMVPLTGFHRFRKHVFANPEDCVLSKSHRVKFDDPDVERARRAHLNDLESILPYLLTGALYCLTNPDVLTAQLLFSIFTLARFAYTFVYAIVPLPQPTRFLLFGVAYCANGIMLFRILTHDFGIKF